MSDQPYCKDCTTPHICANFGTGYRSCDRKAGMAGEVTLRHLPFPQFQPPGGKPLLLITSSKVFRLGDLYGGTQWRTEADHWSATQGAYVYALKSLSDVIYWAELPDAVELVNGARDARHDAAPLSGHSASDRSELPVRPGGDLRAAWQPIETVPNDGKPFLAWYPQVRLDDDDNLTDEVFGGAAAITSLKGREWDEPEWLSAHGTYFMEDWCFAKLPTHWMPLPKPPEEQS